MNPEITTLRSSVQKNCHISDALFARDYSLCIYLLKMREYFRWEKGYPYGDPLPETELGEWLVERERLWQSLENTEFEHLAVGDQEFAPFDSEAINAILISDGWVYSGGYGGSAKPHFFLAALERREQKGSLQVIVSGREYARDITAPPAMSLGNTVFIRRESLRRVLWERIEEWRWRKQDTPMARAARHYEFDRDLDAALDTMTSQEIESVTLHEIGEHQASALLGKAWEEMLAAVVRTRTEYLARAVRDHLADCSTTLPQLLEMKNEASLHFYFANLTGMRRAIFPALISAYQRWHESGNRQELGDVVARGRDYWEKTARQLLAGYAGGGKQKLEKLAKTVGF